MKKTLAILLALLAAASITLASCQDDGRSTLDDDFDKDNDYVDTDDEDETNDDTDGETTNDNNNENNNNQNVNPTDWEEKNDTVYAGLKINLRSDASKNGDIITTIPFGSAISRIETNGRWDKVTYNGQTGYVDHTYVSLNSGDFTFNACDAAEITIAENASNAVLFYQTPFSPDGYAKFDLDASNVLLASGIKAPNLTTGYSLKKVAISQSGNWVKVEFTGTVTIGSSTKTCNAETFYIRALSFNRGDIVDSSWNNSSNPGGDGAHG